MIPEDQGMWDNMCVKRQCLHLSTVLAMQVLLVDEWEGPLSGAARSETDN